MTATNLKQVEKNAHATATSVKGSVQKVQLVCKLITGLKAYEAMLQLQFCKQRAARCLHTLLRSAIANAVNNLSLDIDNLYVSEILVGKSFMLKRFSARARGRGTRIVKPFSRVTIILNERV